MLAALLLAGSFAGAQTFTLDPSTGSLRAKFFRDGPLAAFGRDHTVAASSFTGTVELSSASAAMTMRVDARALKVVEEDEPADFQKWVSGHISDLALASQSIEPVPEEKATWHLIAQLTHHGEARTVEAPVAVRDGPGGGRWFSGYVRLRQSDFGVKPYSTFAGAIRVSDDVVVSFDLLGRPEPR